ncbi:MAG: CRTAC1 family protein [Planctomycetaceae bacterium]
MSLTLIECSARSQSDAVSSPRLITITVLGLLLLVAGCGGSHSEDTASIAPVETNRIEHQSRDVAPSKKWKPRTDFDTSGFSLVGTGITRWDGQTSLAQLKEIWTTPGLRAAAQIQSSLPNRVVPADVVRPVMAMAMFLSYEGQTKEAYQALVRLRKVIEQDSAVAREWLYSVIYFQGVIALRQGENDNCIACRGESSCILPLVPAALHTNDWGSRTAMGHFREYLSQFPDDRQVQWLLNLAAMTLGEHPAGVEAEYLISLDHWGSPCPVGAFREISADTRLDRFNQSGGGIVDDFDNDGLFDVVVSSISPCAEMAFSRNLGDGRFAELIDVAGLSGQLGGLYCVQADFDNDGFIDIFIPRGAWFLSPIRPTLLRNLGDGTFIDVTEESGCANAVNSNSAAWADFDQDGDLDLFVCCEQQPNQLYRNQGDGRFSIDSALPSAETLRYCKGATWGDFNNDGWPDLFLNNLQGKSQLLQNQVGHSFLDVTDAVGITGPEHGFSCWSWDYNNDGWLDILATSYEREIPQVLNGLKEPPQQPVSTRLWQNSGSGKFQDRSVEAGVSAMYETMGSNFGDIDNDGWKDFYLGTGDPEIATLIPNRLFHNEQGQRFADITAGSRTGSLQKGHSVCFADWDRNGSQDIFIQMGGAIPGDRYHNLLFQNPGTANHYLSLTLRGLTAARSALGARVRVKTKGPQPRTIYETLSSGSSFGANPLELHIGLGPSVEIEELEIQWPGSGLVQSFRDLRGDVRLTAIEGRDELVPVLIPPIDTSLR